MGKKELGSAIEYRKHYVGEEIEDTHSAVECPQRLRGARVNDVAMAGFARNGSLAITYSGAI